MTTTIGNDNDVDVASPWRPSLLGGGAAAAILFVSTVVLSTINTVTFFAVVPKGALGEVWASLGSEIGVAFVRDLLLGVGVALSFRLLATRPAMTSWRQAVARTLVLAASGSVLVFVGLALLSLLTAFNPGQHPFGYDFQPSLNDYNVGMGVLSALVSAVLIFVGALPVVGLVLLWLRVFPAGLRASARI